jgi:hypothetical protein
MLFMRMVLTLLLLPSFLCPPQAFGQVAADQRASKEMLYQRVIRIVERKTAPIRAQLPQGNVLVVAQEKNSAVRAELRSQAQKLEGASNYDVAQYKRELLRLNESELLHSRSELHGYINALTDREIAEISAFLAANPMYEDMAMEMNFAYTTQEKRAAIKQALSKDLSFLRSVYSQQLGRSSAEDLRRDLERNLSLFEQDQKSLDKKWVITMLALAGVALVTWGIASSTYGGRYKRALNERERQLTTLKQNLEAQFQAYKADLSNQEMNYLRDNGFVRTVCGTYSMPDSILCNRYNYQLFQGQRHCTVHCFKSTRTGQETLHEAPICTSPFIPGDCYDPSEYWNAYDRGRIEGYADGEWDGTIRGRRDGEDRGRDEGRRDGESDGREDGRRDGYQRGYNDGYSRGASDGARDSAAPKSMKSSLTSDPDPDYQRGFKDGLEQYQILFLNF